MAACGDAAGTGQTSAGLPIVTPSENRGVQQRRGVRDAPAVVPGQYTLPIILMSAHTSRTVWVISILRSV
jgi:hypothetical protein